MVTYINYDFIGVLSKNKQTKKKHIFQLRVYHLKKSDKTHSKTIHISWEFPAHEAKDVLGLKALLEELDALPLTWEPW